MNSVVGVIGVVVLAVGALQLPVVQQTILEIAVKTASQETGTRIRLKGTHGFFPWTLNAERLDVSRDGAPLLQVRDLGVSWSPLSLLRGRIVVDDVSAGTVTFWQPPAVPEEEPASLKLPDLTKLPKLAVNAIRIGDLAVYQPGMENPMHFGFAGGAALAPERQTLQVDLQSLEDAAERVQLTATHARLADELELSADIHVTDKGPLSGLLTSLAIPQVKMTLTGSGPASDWSGHLKMSLGERLQSDLDLHCDCENSWAFSLKGALDGTELKPVDDVSGNEDALTVDLTLSGKGLSPQITLSTVKFAKGPVQGVANGHFDLAPKTGDQLSFDVTAALEGSARSELADYLPLRVNASGALKPDGKLALPLVGAETDFARVDVTELSFGAQGAMSGNVQADVQTAQLPVPAVQSRGLGRVRFAGAVSLSKDQLLQVRGGRLTAEGPGADLTLEGDYDINAEKVTFKTAGTLAKPLQAQGRTVTFKGPLQVSGTIAGFNAAGAAQLTADLPATNVDGEAAPPLHFDGTVTGLTGPTAAQATLVSRGSTPWLSKLDVALDWGLVDTAACRGTLSVRAEGEDFSGTVDGCLQGAAGLNDASARVEAKGLRWFDYTAGALAADIRWKEAVEALSFAASAEGSDFNLGGVLVARSSFSLEGAQTQEGLEAKLGALEVVLREATYRLTAPAAFTQKGKTFDLAQLVIETNSDSFGTGSLTVSDVHINDAISFKARFMDVPLVAMPAKADGDISLELTPQGARGAARLTLASRGEGQTPTEIFLVSDWRSGQVSGTADVSFGGDDTGEKKRFARWTVPVSVTRTESGWQSNVGAATAEVDYDGPIDPLVALFPIYDHRVSGHLVLNGNLDVGDRGPVWQGKATLSDASYAYARGGVALDHLTLTTTASGKAMKVSGKIEVSQDIPNGEGKGATTQRLKGEGTVSFNSIEDWQGAMNVTLKNSPLLHHAYYQGRASGSLSLTANPKAADLKGEISLNELNIQIPPPGPAEIIPLKIVPVDADGNPIVVRETHNTTTWLPELNLDVALQADDRLYLTGRGINTEWQAKGTVKGPTSVAAVSGNMKVLRGTIDFGGRSFDVERGSFQLVKGDVDGALIDIQAKYAAPGGTTARILVSGTVGAPKINFTSSPALPEQEIVALVLFGKPLAELGPVEVLRTGTAIAQISGRSGGFDGGLLTRMRQSLGIDYLSIDPQGGGSDSPVVTAGKYIGKGVFLKVTQGLGDMTGAIGVEYSLTDEITVSTEVSETSETEASIEWKRDY